LESVLAFTTIQIGMMRLVNVFVIGTGSYLQRVQDAALTIATGALFLRSFCQVIIVGQLNRVSNNSQAAFRGFDATYGLFGLVFLGAIEFSIPFESSSEMRGHENTQSSAVGEVKRGLSSLLRSKTQEGLQTAPKLTELLDELAQQLDIPKRVGITDYNPKNDEIKRISRKYKGWRPITRVDEL